LRDFNHKHQYYSNKESKKLKICVFSDSSELGKIAKDGSKLSVEKIAHAALIDVDKDGTEAAAATLIEITFLREKPIAYALKVVIIGCCYMTVALQYLHHKAESSFFGVLLNALPLDSLSF
jgi:hypothetical protein